MIKIEIAQDYTLIELQNLSDILEPYGDGIIVENGTLFVSTFNVHTLFIIC